MESGAGTIPPVHNASRGNGLWQNFTAAVPECASHASTQNTFDCLRSVNTSSILQALAPSPLAALDPNNLAWFPVLDGPNGVLPDLPSKLFREGKYARVPFIAGTNLDERAQPITQSCPINPDCYSSDILYASESEFKR